jgi:hypothetical protein
MHYKRLRNSDRKETEDKIEKNNSCWKDNLTSIGIRLIGVPYAGVLYLGGLALPPGLYPEQ